MYFIVDGAKDVSVEDMLQIGIQGFKKLGVEVYSKEGKNDLFFLKGKIEKKFCGVAKEGDWVSFNLNVSSDLSKYNFFKDTTRDVRNIGVISEINSKIDVKVVTDTILQSFSERFELPLIKDTFGSGEQKLFDEYRKIYTDPEWIYNGNVDRFPESVCQKEQSPYEFDLIINFPLLTNRIDFSLQSKEVNFYYQPRLTKEERDNGNGQPADTIGSYAVYHKTKRDNFDDVNYRAGKVGHIYRPKITDANGEWVWGELSIKDDTLSITIPREFLDKATYPLNVDPTFGYETQGTAGSSPMNAGYYLCKFTGAAGTATNISACISSTTSAYNANCGITTFSSPTFTKITNGGSKVVSVGTAKAFYDFGFDVNPTITAIDYWLACNSAATIKQSCVFYYDAGDANQGATTTTFYNATFPSALTFNVNNNNKYSIHCDYTTGGPAKLKTWNGLATAKIKTINGLAIAKVKTINGLT
jgi:hypothetical protein